jgi:transposase InsO family protein
MPWSTTPVSELRTAFAHAVRTTGQSVAAAARDFGISRKTAYKWLARFDAQQPLSDRSRRPHRSPKRTAEADEATILAIRDQFGWGPRKIVAYLRNHNLGPLPVRTAAAILRRHGRIVPRPTPPAADQRFERSGPNQLWQVDFKGFIEIARHKVYPFTVLDDHSRFLLALGCGEDLTMARAWNILWELFGQYGLPDSLLCDNAFGSWGLGVSWFDARLLRLGIQAIHGRPYHPQTQGKVERLHATLETEVFPRLTRDDRTAFEAGLELWRRDVYNTIRPHEALGDLPPITRWRPSSRPRPRQLPVFDYPPHTLVRRVASSGEIRWRGAKVLAGKGLVGDWVKLEEINDSLVLWYGPHRIRQIPLDQLHNSGLV